MQSNEVQSKSIVTKYIYLYFVLYFTIYLAEYFYFYYVTFYHKYLYFLLTTFFKQARYFRFNDQKWDGNNMRSLSSLFFPPTNVNSMHVLGSAP